MVVFETICALGRKRGKTFPVAPNDLARVVQILYFMDYGSWSIDLLICGSDLWICGSMDLWICGSIDLWILIYGSVDLWICGSIGSVDLLICGSIDQLIYRSIWVIY